MELNHPLLRVPFEKVNRSFRLYQKQVTRELSVVGKQIDALYEEQQPAQRMDIDAMIEKLTEIASQIRALKEAAKEKVLHQQQDLDICLQRMQYIQDMEATTVLAAAKHKKQMAGSGSVDQAADLSDHSINDRLIADYLLCQGYLESSKIIQDTKEIGYLVDHELHQECRAIVLDLRSHNPATAIAWCNQNGSRLRRLQSPLEFRLRLQEFIEFVRSNKKLEAIQYAQSFLTPLAMQREDEVAKQGAIEQIQEAMATLAYKSPEQCGVTSYAKLFAMSRWDELVEIFRKTFFEVYSIHNPPSLCIALHAGLSTLNTRTCFRTRDANAKARLVHRRESSGEQKQGDGDEEEGEEHDADDSDGIWSKQSHLYPKIKKTKLSDKHPLNPINSNQYSSKRNKEYLKHLRDIDAIVPICPTCSDVGSRLCAGLPFAYHPHSRLVCRVTKKVMDENNPPLVLPNGHVYSKQGIDQMTHESERNGMIKCAETQEVFAVSEAKPVYIL